MTTAEHLSSALLDLSEPLKLELAREVARISEHAFRRGAQQAADHGLDPDLAERVRFDVPYDEHPIYINRPEDKSRLPFIGVPWCRTSLERVSWEADNADAEGLAPLLRAACDTMKSQP
jgi:hypothetical protein